MEYKGNLESLELLLPAVIFGAEGENDGDSTDSTDGDNDSDDTDAGSADVNKDEVHDDADDERTKGLRSALQKERARANKAEKAEKAALKDKEARELAEKTEVEQAQILTQKAQERAEKLSNGFLQRSLNDSIRKAAQDLKFIDPTDAIEGVERSGFVYEQDEDDPSEVEIDEKSIIAAVKALSAKKPHFIRTGTDDGEPTGGQFGGSRKKKTTTEDEFKKKYPALRNS